MKLLYSLSIFAFAPLMQYCSSHQDPQQAEKVLIIKTIDGFGKPVPSTIVYESRDCEYDFSLPKKIHSDKNGITVLNVPAGYLQIYAEGFVDESYRCFVYSGNTQTITIYAAALPTYIQTTPHSVVTYFQNRSGDCDYEFTSGTSVIADSVGKATIWFPVLDVYKIQSDGKAVCFQPDQEVHTIKF